MKNRNAEVALDSGDITVRVGVSEFLEGISEEALSQLAQSMTFRDQVFNAVADRLIDGHTKDAYWQGESEDDIHEKHRMRILASLPEVEKRVVGLLIRQRERHRAEAKAMAAWAWRMYHAANYPDADAMARREALSAPDWWKDVAHLTESDVAAIYDAAKDAVTA